MFIVIQIIEKTKEKKIILNFHFIDFKSAFDSVFVSRRKFWKMLRFIGVSPKIADISERTYRERECTIMADKNLTT